jgi:phosphohistidine phosphatase
MKTITFLRHSKSSWEYDVSDINRPLNEFGINKIKKVSNLSRDTFGEFEIIF